MYNGLTLNLLLMYKYNIFFKLNKPVFISTPLKTTWRYPLLNTVLKINLITQSV